MSPLAIGALYGDRTLVVMFSGMPIAFALGLVAVVFMFFFMPASALDTVGPERLRGDGQLDHVLSIPLFILKGAAIGRTRAGRDLYLALHAWFQRGPGRTGGREHGRLRAVRRHVGLFTGDVLGDRLAGIPEMRKRGYPGGFAAGIIAAGGTLGILLPPSITMILYAVAAESLARQAVPGRHRPGPAADHAVRRLLGLALPPRNTARDQREARADGVHSAILRQGELHAGARRSSCCLGCCRS